MLQANFQTNIIRKVFEEEVDFVIFAIFSNGSHL